MPREPMPPLPPVAEGRPYRSDESFGSRLVLSWRVLQLFPAALNFGRVEVGRQTRALEVRIRNPTPDPVPFSFLGDRESDARPLVIDYPVAPWIVPPLGEVSFTVALRPWPSQPDSLKLPLYIVAHPAAPNATRLCIEIEAEAESPRRFAYAEVEVPVSQPGKTRRHRFVVVTDPVALYQRAAGRLAMAPCIGVPASTEGGRVHENTPVGPGQLLLDPSVTLLDGKWAKVFGFYAQGLDLGDVIKNERQLGDATVNARLVTILAHLVGMVEHDPATCRDCVACSSGYAGPRRGEVLRAPRSLPWQYLIPVAPDGITEHIAGMYWGNTMTLMVPASQADPDDQPDGLMSRVGVEGLGSLDVYLHRLCIYWYRDPETGERALPTGFELDAVAKGLLAARAGAVLGLH